MYRRVCPHRAQSLVGEVKSSLLSAMKEIVAGCYDRSRGRAGGRTGRGGIWGGSPDYGACKKGRNAFYKKERVCKVIIETAVGWQEVRLARWGVPISDGSCV